MPNQFGPTFVNAADGILAGPVALTNIISPAQLTANTDDWNPTGLSNAVIIRASMDAQRNLTGIVAPPQDGRVLVLENVSATITMLLVHDATSTAANRFYIGGLTAGGTLPVPANQSVMMVYDTTSQRWRVVSLFGPTATVPVIAGTAATGTSPFWARGDHAHPSEGVVSSTYTPTLTQSGAVTKTTTYAHYIQLGKLVWVWGLLAATGAGTTNNSVLVGLPVTAVSASSAFVGTGSIVSGGGVTNYPVQWYLASTTTIAASRSDVNWTNDWGKDPNLALASGDKINFALYYEAA